MTATTHRSFCAAILLLLTAVKPFTIRAQDSVRLADEPLLAPATHRFNLHFQGTYIYQYKPGFFAQYSGPNSLITKEEKTNSVTMTLAFGAKLWRGGELYINPEVAGGSGPSGAFGLGASTNGETFRVGNPEPTLYLARGYVAHTFPLGKDREFVPDAMNETGGNKPAEYVKLYLGKLCLGDILDNNEYANSPRTQFMNWCLMNNGAWDYAANTRGYTYTFTAVAKIGRITYKAAIATLPTTANGPELNTNLGEAYSLNAEVTRSYKAGRKKMEGNVRLLVYHNSGYMGSYTTALSNRDTSGRPSVTLAQKPGGGKTGICISADQQLTPTIGAFLRLGWNDGQHETWCYTEVDQTLTAGVTFNGETWRRKEDNIGFAAIFNGISNQHRNYLGAGGLGFQLGDGSLNYKYETAVEFYYSYKPFRQGIWLTADYQYIANPGYNHDRGPVNVFSARVHVEL